jgi:hypothetical protein
VLTTRPRRSVILYPFYLSFCGSPPLNTHIERLDNFQSLHRKTKKRRLETGFKYFISNFF